MVKSFVAVGVAGAMLLVLLPNLLSRRRTPAMQAPVSSYVIADEAARRKDAVNVNAEMVQKGEPHSYQGLPARSRSPRATNEPASIRSC
jgi:hypothetical protein